MPGKWAGKDCPPYPSGWGDVNSILAMRRQWPAILRVPASGSWKRKKWKLVADLAAPRGPTINLSKLAGSLGIDGKTARRYLDLLEGLYLVRSLPPWSRNAGKRLVKSAKVYWRDSGILHVLAGLPTLETVLGHPLCGASWEGYCIEQILARLPKGASASHYRTQAGAEVDLVIEMPDGQILAVEINRTLSPKVTPGLVESMETLGAKRGVIVIPRGESYPLSTDVTAIGLRQFLEFAFCRGN